jgi:3-mercaptopyruvate sulfurtransferase SseA
MASHGYRKAQQHGSPCGNTPVETVGVYNGTEILNFKPEATMAFTTDEIRANRDYFAHKLRAEKSRNDVLKAVEGGTFNFVLLDTRGREPFASGHIPGALCAPISELAQLIELLPKDKEVVTYCWGHD